MPSYPVTCHLADLSTGVQIHVPFCQIGLYIEVPIRTLLIRLVNAYHYTLQIAGVMFENRLPSFLDFVTLLSPDAIFTEIRDSIY